MLDFVKALAKKIKKNKAALELHARIYDPPGILKSPNPDALLSIKHLFHHVQVREAVRGSKSRPKLVTLHRPKDNFTWLNKLSE